MNIYWTWSYSRPRSYTNVQTTDGGNYVTKLESKWSVTYGERLQMAPASATDVPWMCFFDELLIFPSKCGIYTMWVLRLR